MLEILNILLDVYGEISLSVGLFTYISYNRGFLIEKKHHLGIYQRKTVKVLRFM
jgi:hypothetical protein